MQSECNSSDRNFSISRTLASTCTDFKKFRRDRAGVPVGNLKISGIVNRPQLLPTGTRRSAVILGERIESRNLGIEGLRDSREFAIGGFSVLGEVSSGRHS